MTGKTDVATTDASKATPAAKPDPNRVVLSRPVGTGDNAITAFTVREPSPGELRGIKLSLLLNLDVGTLIAILPRVTTPYLDETALSQLPMKDFTRLSTTLVGFFVDVEEVEGTMIPPSPTT